VSVSVSKEARQSCSISTPSLTSGEKAQIRSSCLLPRRDDRVPHTISQRRHQPSCLYRILLWIAFQNHSVARAQLPLGVCLQVPRRLKWIGADVLAGRRFSAHASLIFSCQWLSRHPTEDRWQRRACLPRPREFVLLPTFLSRISFRCDSPQRTDVERPRLS
jgi:hypothetical protein